MDLARVIGNLEATVKYPGLEGVKLAWVQPLDEKGEDRGSPLVACDATQSGTGDTVFYCGGREASLALDIHFVPVDASIVGIVDEVDLMFPDEDFGKALTAGNSGSSAEKGKKRKKRV